MRTTDPRPLLTRLETGALGAVLVYFAGIVALIGATR